MWGRDQGNGPGEPHQGGFHCDDDPTVRPALSLAIQNTMQGVGSHGWPKFERYTYAGIGQSATDLMAQQVNGIDHVDYVRTWAHRHVIREGIHKRRRGAVG